MYPDAVDGLVLVDPVPEDFYARAAGVVPDRYTVEEETYLKELYTDSTRLAEQREGAAYPSSMEQARASDEKHRTPTTLLIAAGGESRSQAGSSLAAVGERTPELGRPPSIGEHGGRRR
jgi:hypothetical protein